MKQIFGVPLLAWLWAGIATAQAIEENKVLDLTYSFDEHPIYWPTAKSFQLEVVSAGKTKAGYWYAANNLCPNGENKPGLENIAHLEKLPPKGATLIALPMKIAKGSGGPTRIIAILLWLQIS